MESIIVKLQSASEVAHVALAGLLSLFIYRDTVKHMSKVERVAYCVLSMVIGLYGGGAFIEWFNIDPASKVARFVSIAITVFGLAIFGLARDNLHTLSQAVVDWLIKILP